MMWILSRIMKRPSVKCVLLLLTTFIICTILYATSSDLVRKQTAGGSVQFPGVALGTTSAGADETLEGPCSLRKVVRDDVFFRRMFNFSVPVLQWEKSFSRSTWEHLKIDSPPYGWKGIPEEVLQSVLPLLVSSQLFNRDSPDQCVRCAVVGNGGILRGSQQGKNIDNHDYVFRVNGAVIRGFEEDVGSKISFYGFTANTMKHALVWYQREGFTKIPQSLDMKYIWIPSDLRDYVMLLAALRSQPVDSGQDEGDRPWDYFGHKPPESFKILNPSFISYLTNSFLSSHLKTNIRTRHLYMPSTGALMLLTALHTCDQVSAYGFITKNFAEFSDHYYDRVRRPLIFYANHDLKMESRLWEILDNRRIMRLYQRTGAKS